MIGGGTGRGQGGVGEGRRRDAYSRGGDVRLDDLGETHLGTCSDCRADSQLSLGKEVLKMVEHPHSEGVFHVHSLHAGEVAS